MNRLVEMGMVNNNMSFGGSCDVEIIATGDELLLGRTLDTNSHWIAKRLVDMGARLRRVTMVGDDLKEIGDALEEALSRANDLIIFTGGLGPSGDDLTVEAIGLALDRGIEYDPATRERIEDLYRLRGDRDTDRGLRMARVLEGSRALQNTVGFSVGMMLEVRGRLIFTLPGVPEEMREMFNGEIVPIIEDRSNIRFYPKTVKVRMVWKDFFPLLREIQREFPNIYLKNVATPPVEEDDRHNVHDIVVYIVVKGNTLGEAKNRMKDFLEEYERRIMGVGGGEIIPS